MDCKNKYNELKQYILANDITIKYKTRALRKTAYDSIKKRRETDKYNKELDKKLHKDMGTSAGAYKTTKKGLPRKEYYGK
jgi:hypothetical protein